VAVWKAAIELEVHAKNFDSAQKKIADAERRLRHADVHVPHSSMKPQEVRDV
jgi:hypothetical protein